MTARADRSARRATRQQPAAEPVDTGRLLSGRDRLRCLVVDSDRIKRAFLAEAWAYFHPGFDVVTAASTEAALEWIRSTPLHIISVGRSVGPESVDPLLRAMSAVPEERLWCLVIERHPEAGAWDLPMGGFRVVDLWDALSLEQVLRVGRLAADLVGSAPTDHNLIVLPGPTARPVPAEITPNGTAPTEPVRS